MGSGGPPRPSSVAVAARGRSALHQPRLSVNKAPPAVPKNRTKEPLVPGAPKAENERSRGGPSCPTASTGNADTRILVPDRKKSSRSRRRRKKKTLSDRGR